MIKIYGISQQGSDTSEFFVARNEEEAASFYKELEGDSDNLDIVDVTTSTWIDFGEDIVFSIKKGLNDANINLPLGHLDWSDFLDILETRNLFKFDFYYSIDDSLVASEMFGFESAELEALSDKVGRDLNNFEEICEAYGVDVDLITFKQLVDIKNGTLNIKTLKELQTNLVEKQF